MQTPPQIIVVSNKSQSEWLFAVTKALEPLGYVRIMSENDALAQINSSPPALVITDASAIEKKITAYVGQLHNSQPDLPILVVTASPTWRHARSIFLAGAADYIRKSLDIDRILVICKELLPSTLAAIGIALR